MPVDWTGLTWNTLAVPTELSLGGLVAEAGAASATPVARHAAVARSAAGLLRRWVTLGSALRVVGAAAAVSMQPRRWCRRLTDRWPLSREPAGASARPTRVRTRDLIRVVGVCGVLAGALAGCASAPTGGGASDSCAATVEYDGATYWGRGGLQRTPDTTGRTFPAMVPGCDDTGGQDPHPDEGEVVQVE